MKQLWHGIKTNYYIESEETVSSFFKKITNESIDYYKDLENALCEVSKNYGMVGISFRHNGKIKFFFSDEESLNQAIIVL